MNRRLRHALAGLALTTAAVTGTLTLHHYQPSGDTAWGAPATTNDTAWGTPPTTGDNPDGDGTVLDPLDTAWG